MTDAVKRAKGIAKQVLAGQYDPLLACREISDLREDLPAVADEVMLVFVGVASEVDGLPIGAERAYWAADSLRDKDREVADYRAQVGSVVAEALRKLVEAIED